MMPRQAANVGPQILNYIRQRKREEDANLRENEENPLLTESWNSRFFPLKEYKEQLFSSLQLFRNYIGFRVRDQQALHLKRFLNTLRFEVNAPLGYWRDGIEEGLRYLLAGFIPRLKVLIYFYSPPKQEEEGKEEEGGERTPERFLLLLALLLCHRDASCDPCTATRTEKRLVEEICQICALLPNTPVQEMVGFKQTACQSIGQDLQQSLIRQEVKRFDLYLDLSELKARCVSSSWLAPYSGTFFEPEEVLFLTQLEHVEEFCMAGLPFQAVHELFIHSYLSDAELRTLNDLMDICDKGFSISIKKFSHEKFWDLLDELQRKYNFFVTPPDYPFPQINKIKVLDLTEVHRINLFCLEWLLHRAPQLETLYLNRALAMEGIPSFVFSSDAFLSKQYHWVKEVHVNGLDLSLITWSDSDEEETLSPNQATERKITERNVWQGACPVHKMNFPFESRLEFFLHKFPNARICEFTMDTKNRIAYEAYERKVGAEEAQFRIEIVT